MLRICRNSGGGWLHRIAKDHLLGNIDSSLPVTRNQLFPPLEEKRPVCLTIQDFSPAFYKQDFIHLIITTTTLCSFMEQFLCALPSSRAMVFICLNSSNTGFPPILQTLSALSCLRALAVDTVPLELCVPKLAPCVNFFSEKDY